MTQLQDSVNEINVLFYNCAGVLQRDARPASTTDGELGNDLGEGGVTEMQVKEFASAVGASRKIDALASALPKVELDADVQLRRIHALQKENDEVERELLNELANADEMMSRVTAAFEATTNETVLSQDGPAS